MALARGQLDQRFGEYEPETKSRVRTLSFDFETYCDLDLKQVGLDLYSSHPSCEVLMCAYSLDGGRTTQHWDRTRNPRMPRDLHDALMDDRVELWAFNAQFERTILNRVLDIWPPMKRWRCTMVLAYFHSFVGTLDRVAHQCGLPADKSKLATGSRLIKMFCGPQKITKTNSLKRFTRDTHPVEWAMFCEYNEQDVVAECAVKKRLDKPQYPIPAREWRFYALDQRINDRGLPIDRTFVERALDMAEARKDELLTAMRRATGLVNPGSPAQLLPWLQERGYPYADLRKDSVKKVLTADAGRRSGELKPKKGELYPTLTDECVAVLKLRQQQARTTPTKYAALLKAMGTDNRMRYVFQFAGASRTARFAGRRFQPQNLTTMRLGGEDHTHLNVITQITDAIRANDKEAVALFKSEPMDALAGLVRSSVRAKKGKKLVVCDLSSIESVVIGWVSGCERLLNVFREGRDAYKDFATELYGIPYAEVTSYQRKMAKPATLGAGYRLGGGEIREGKKTGLWGYAENMGIDMTRKEAHRGVATFRRVYKEIPQTWYALEKAIIDTIRRGITTTVGPITFSYRKPYLVCHLPSGRNIYYLKPRVEKKPFRYIDKDTGEEVVTMKDSISYMGKQQNGNNWIRVYSHGGKFIENIVQAVARDILREGLMAAHKDGFNIIGHVHDEIICEEDEHSNYYGVARLRELMIQAIKWAKGMPLNAAGHEGKIYRKD
jgi:DNA polymerase